MSLMESPATLKTRTLLALLYEQVNFPANSNSNCASSDPDCGSDGFCKPCPSLNEAHDTCHSYSGESFSQDADGTITTSFGALVAAAPGGCCQANSCVGSYFESQYASMAAGDKVYFDSQVIFAPPPPPSPPRPAPPPPRPAPNTR